MANAQQLLGGLVAIAFGRRRRRAPQDAAAPAAPPDGSPAPAAVAAEAASAPAAVPPGPKVPANAPHGRDDTVLATLAAKVLQAHFENRHQLFDPPPWEFRNLDELQSELFMRAMIAAANADGQLDASEEGRIQAALDLVGTEEEDRRFLAEAMASPVALDVLLRDVRDTVTAARFYAASLLAIDPRTPVNRSYLHYLAARLGLPPEILVRLNRQFKVPA